MMLGSYPCCNAALMLAMPEVTPRYMPETCPSCGAKVWHRFSRIDPMSWTEADFLAEHEVDEATHQVKERPARASDPWADLDARLNALPPDVREAVMAQCMRDSLNILLYGDSEGPREGAQPVGIILNPRA